MALETDLMKEVSGFRAATFSVNTRKSYSTHMKKYLEFCEMINRPPVPASSTMIAKYAAYLARSLKPASVRQYINIIRVLHLEEGLSNPLDGNWYVKSTLKGIDRLLGEPTKRKSPVTPEILWKIKSRLSLTDVSDCMFWAACMLMFFGLLRKSNLMPNSVNQFDAKKQFVRSDFTALGDVAIVVNVKYSKTNQFNKRPFELKLLSSSHPLCPVAAIHSAFSLFPSPKDSPAFVASHLGLPLTGNLFNKKFKSLIEEVNEDSSRFSSHSFRRGGASWALQCGVPGEVVQQLGDWRSESYKDYLDELPQKVHDHYRKLFVSHLPSFHPVS